MPWLKKLDPVEICTCPKRPDPESAGVGSVWLCGICDTVWRIHSVEDTITRPYNDWTQVWFFPGRYRPKKETK